MEAVMTAKKFTKDDELVDAFVSRYLMSKKPWKSPDPPAERLLIPLSAGKLSPIYTNEKRKR
jgi:hypothetical protein